MAGFERIGSELVSARYTYAVPAGASLYVGDEVEVPVTYGTKIGTVVDYGRGPWDGPTKPVLARVTREAL